MFWNKRKEANKKNEKGKPSPIIVGGGPRGGTSGGTSGGPSGGPSGGFSGGSTPGGA